MEKIEFNVQTGERKIVPLTAAEISEREQNRLLEIQNQKANAPALRQAAYRQESDPLFFMWQAGESTEAEWKAKRDEIKARFPKE